MDEDQDLGETDSEEESPFPPPERKIVTQPYDLSIRDLVDQWHDETVLLPDIQREYVWDNRRASRLVESLLLNIPIPVLYLAETPDAKWEIIDGHQRINSLVRFLGNEFALSSLGVLSDLNHKRFHQIPAREQRFLERRAMRAIVISNESHPNMKFEIFERLNTGAVVLNAQEIRNSLFRGTFNALLRELARNPVFRECIGSKAPRKRMVDEELILRFFALRTDIVRYRPPLKRFLNNFMDSMRSPGAAVIENFEQTFQDTIVRVHEGLGPSAFRVTDSDGTTVEPAVNRALFDAQMLAFSWTDPGQNIGRHRRQINLALGELYENAEFVDSISLATGDRARTLYRLTAVISALQACDVSLSLPANL